MIALIRVILYFQLITPLMCRCLYNFFIIYIYAHWVVSLIICILVVSRWSIYCVPIRRDRTIKTRLMLTQLWFLFVQLHACSTHVDYTFSFSFLYIYEHIETFFNIKYNSREDKILEFNCNTNSTPCWFAVMFHF